AVAHARVELLERTRVEQLLDPFAGGQLALGVLLLDGGLGGGVDRLVAPLFEQLELLLVGFGDLLAHRGRHGSAAAVATRCARMACGAPSPGLRAGRSACPRDRRAAVDRVCGAACGPRSRPPPPAPRPTA